MSKEMLRQMELARRSTRQLPRWKRPRLGFIGAENSDMMRRTLSFNSNVLRRQTEAIEAKQNRYRMQYFKEQERVYSLQNCILLPVSENLELNDPARHLRHEYQRRKKQVSFQRYRQVTDPEVKQGRQGVKAKMTLSIYKNTFF